MQVVIADAGPLIAWARLQQLDLLARLFRTDWITDKGQQVLVVIDDSCGRAEALRQGLSIIGTAAVLVLAKEQGLIPACAPLLQTLRQQGYDLSDQVIATVLNQAGEA